MPPCCTTRNTKKTQTRHTAGETNYLPRQRPSVGVAEHEHVHLGRHGCLAHLRRVITFGRRRLIKASRGQQTAGAVRRRCSSVTNIEK